MRLELFYNTKLNIYFLYQNINSVANTINQTMSQIVNLH